MNLPSAPDQYSRSDQQSTRNEISRADDLNLKKDRHLNLQTGVGIELVDTVDGTRYRATVASGAWVLTAL